MIFKKGIKCLNIAALLITRPYRKFNKHYKNNKKYFIKKDFHIVVG